MKATVGDYLLERLRDWDVEHVFAYAGDGINGILAAWGRAENKPQFIQARHEEMAAQALRLRGRLAVRAFRARLRAHPDPVRAADQGGRRRLPLLRVGRG